jgi:2-polyprenyl-3-methyl-5-hydroxy-6-metoxy-1,4-benzoquinol methylase
MVTTSWKKISPNPNSLEALHFRTNTLVKARRRGLIADRISYICELASGKNVLDIGVVDHFTTSCESVGWLHEHLCNCALSCLGVDILGDEIRLLHDKGYNVLAWDITRGPIAGTFELIVIGDVVEHLGNPSALFSSVARMLSPNGRIILTTPNPWYANAIVKNLFEGKPFTDNADHIAWFDAGTLCELAARNGLHLDCYAGVMTTKASTTRASLFFTLSPFLIKLGFRPEFFAKTMVYEFVLPTSG